MRSVTGPSSHVGHLAQDLGQKECPASALAMVINGLRKGIIIGA